VTLDADTNGAGAPSSYKLGGKIAVITGGTSGIGLAMAKRFVSEGAHVFIMGRRESELGRAINEIGTHVTGIQGDVTRLADLDRLYGAVKTQFGQFDILIANAGVGELVPLTAVTEEHFDKTFNVNVKGTLFTVQKGLPLLNDGGSIILTGSLVSIQGVPEFGVYCATKAAVRSFVRTWALELKQRRIRANVISPGTIDTPMLAPIPKEAFPQIISTIPLGRLGRPDEIAAAAVFLASDDASYITGIELFVDGGAAQV
jgi:NAD(P)-dependent dehydrogenase (short-subunit alcohol dehydrogenase family)